MPGEPRLQGGEPDLPEQRASSPTPPASNPREAPSRGHGTTRDADPARPALDSVERHPTEGKGSFSSGRHTRCARPRPETHSYVTSEQTRWGRGTTCPQRPGPVRGAGAGAAPEASPVSSEEVLDQRGHHLHPQLHLPTGLLEGGGGHHARPQVELRLLLRKSAGLGSRGRPSPSPKAS